MKDYLKMEDEFDFDDAAIEQRLFGGCISKEEATYAAHAINSHDELVQTNKELLAALKMVWSSAAYAYDGISGQYVILDDERELINSLLEMCDVGAA